MDHFAKLIAALVLSFAGTAHAGYAQLAPPPGFSSSGSSLLYRAAANDAIGHGLVRTAAGGTANIAGRAVTVPAAMRFAANASLFAARSSFGNPWIFATLAVGSAAYSYFNDSGYEVQNNQWVKRTTEFDYLYKYKLGPWASSEGAALQGFCAIYNVSGCFINTQYNTVQGRRADGTLTSFGNFEGFQRQQNQSQTVRPATPQEFENDLAPKELPDGLPQKLPVPLPVELPIINPDPVPSPNPAPRPLFVPTGDPRPNPQYNPSAPPGADNLPFIQPGVRIVPSPTLTEPWRVDHQPVNRPQADGMPNPNPDAEPGTNPADKPKPEEQQSLCEKHPDIVACAKLGEPGQATPVPNETKTLTIAPENGFGPSGGSCPPPRTVEVAGLTLSMPFDLLCDFATGLKPVIVGLAWLTAAFTFMGIGRRS